jgi:hypothetical protein
MMHYIFGKDVQYFKWIFVGFPPLWPRFKLGSMYVRFAVDKAALGQVFWKIIG